MDISRESARATLFDEEKIKDFSDLDPEATPSWTKKFKHSHFFRPVIILFSLLIVILPIYLTISPRSGALKYDQCGTTADEARARGCVFEITGFTWLPKECHDRETEEEFLQHITASDASDLKFYRDTNYTDIVSIEEARRGDGPGFFVTQQYHVTHCLFLIKKLHRAYASGRTLDGQIMPTHHTEHCVEMTLKPPGFRKGAVQLSYTKFPYCGKPGGWAVGWAGTKPTAWTDE